LLGWLKKCPGISLWITAVEIPVSAPGFRRRPKPSPSRYYGSNRQKIEDHPAHNFKSIFNTENIAYAIGNSNENNGNNKNFKKYKK
jgi:hypothetical protein